MRLTFKGKTIQMKQLIENVWNLAFSDLSCENWITFFKLVQFWTQIEGLKRFDYKAANVHYPQ